MWVNMCNLCDVLGNKTLKQSEITKKGKRKSILPTPLTVQVDVHDFKAEQTEKAQRRI